MYRSDVLCAKMLASVIVPRRRYTLLRDKSSVRNVPEVLIHHCWLRKTSVVPFKTELRTGVGGRASKIVPLP